MTDSIKEHQHHRDNVKKLQVFIKEIEKVGGQMPLLKKAVDRYLIAINTGGDIAVAAKEAKTSLQIYTQDLKKVCGHDPSGICESHIDRQYQNHALKFVLNPTEKRSVMRRFIDMTICRYAPGFIAEKFDCKEQELF